ncbi:RagB/SusD family nutrient uptake outer membrane protein [Limnovirga soli]|uniref:RagB/SusD family nutrient uptake outer membrane protein n=1 Tax=Limnovirga soli TaxID=2656915 RepID=A0A8J8FEV5_9BACT|nr:RagB/SusD family nutrient uptake outer membrane protein [Limnovirga soli]NNV56187.1 RagB/SusD family nutrient uptake outer membrane protein [Limnovirga soli]
MKNIIRNIFIAGVAVVTVSSCAKKLDLFPQNDLTPATAYSTADGYKNVLAKIYGGLASTGNTGPAGSSDIQGLDEGSQSPFIRGFFNCEELPTDEAVVAWNDQTIHDFHDLKWSSSDPFLLGMYARPIYNITIGNEYLRESTDDKLASRNITGADAESIKESRAEVRFLRAFNYWVMLDLFGKSTFITEDDGIGTFLPKEIQRPELFSYIESELLAIQSDLAPAKTAVYGRVDQAAAWALLARLYLNAEVYTGTAKFTEAATYSKKVIDAGYALQPDYRKLFMADNDSQKDEFIYAINCDGLKTQSYGNTTFFVHCAAGDDHADFGVGGGWYGYRSTAAFASLFTDLTGETDQRALFTTSAFTPSPEQLVINNISDFNNGLHVNKYVNIRSDGGAVSDVQNNFSDVDFPVFRLSEMYLIYAEAHLRGAGGTDAATALEYVNKIRYRAYGNSYGPGEIGKLSSADLTLQLVLDERGRELYWEGHRRTDLIRYGLLTSGTYLWPWKGGVSSGTAVDSKYNIFPIPAANLTANPSLTQNAGY